MSTAKIKVKTVLDVLTYLAAATGFCSVCAEIRPVYIPLFAGLIIFSAYLTFFGRLVTSRWVIHALCFGVIASFFYGLNTGDLLPRMIQTLLALLCIKLLEEKKPRDYMQIYAVSLLLVAGSGLMSPSIVFLGFFFALLLFLASASVLLSYCSEDPSIELTAPIVARIVRCSLLIPLCAIPLAAVMFLILPRTDYPLLQFLNGSEKARTALSDRVRLGSIRSIQESPAVALRVNMERVKEENLYWRGIVLDYFDGTSWKSSPRKVSPPHAQVRLPGKPVRQTIYLEPSENRCLPALDTPLSVSVKNARRLDDGTFVAPAYRAGRIRYEAESAVSDRIPETAADVRRYLQVPSHISGRVAALVMELGRGKSEKEKIDSFLRYLTSGAFRYSMDNLPLTRNPVDSFLFQSRYGNCEYFASVYALMLRISGIPARIVGGYRGGFYNSIGKYYLVPEASAHVWTEVFVKGKGWLRVDPTPVFSESLALSAKRTLWMDMRLLFDTMNYYWYAFVINYDLEKQTLFVRSLRKALMKPRLDFVSAAGRSDLLKYLGILLLVVGGAWVLLRNVRLRRTTAEERILALFERKMEKRGYRKKPSQGLEEFVSTIDNKEIRTAAGEFVKIFEEFYYRDRALTRGGVKQLKTMLDAI